MARLEKQFESATVEWPTPDALWKPLNDEFGFTLDVCATPENAKCLRYFTREDDGLAQCWSGVCWMNPPYGREMVGWLRKAQEERANGVTTVALIPSRTNTGWWHDIVMKNEVRFVRGRPKFGNANEGLPWPLAIVVFWGLGAVGRCASSAEKETNAEVSHSARQNGNKLYHQPLCHSRCMPVKRRARNIST